MVSFAYAPQHTCGHSNVYSIAFIGDDHYHFRMTITISDDSIMMKRREGTVDPPLSAKENFQDKRNR